MQTRTLRRGRSPWAPSPAAGGDGDNEELGRYRIEAFRHPIPDHNFSARTLNTLHHAVDEIYGHRVSVLSYDDLYRNAYNMVLYKHGDALYSGVEMVLTRHLKEMAKSINASAGDINASTGDSFLVQLLNCWNEHVTALKMVCDIYMYMDKNYIPGANKPRVYDLGLNLWREIVLQSSAKTKLLDILLDRIQQERMGGVIDRGLMRNLTEMLKDVGSSTYEAYFEQPYLDASVRFYTLEAQVAIESCDCGNYLLKVESRLNEEIQRVANYLDASTEEKITGVVSRVMIADQMQRLVSMENSGLTSLLVNSKLDHLRRMYTLVHRQPGGTSIMRDAMSSLLKESGKQLAEDPERLKKPVEYVQDLLNEKDKYDEIIDVAFNKDKTFQTALNASFEYVINLNIKSSEYISLYLDYKLCKAGNNDSEADIEAVIDKVMVLFRSLQDKDLFEKYYRQHLAKRLLSHKLISEDAERIMIGKLKHECGYQFTSKLEAMFRDIKTSEDIVRDFNETGFAEVGKSPAISVNVLTTGSWLTEQCSPCHLPDEIYRISDGFQAYYVGIHNGRRLTWQTNMGYADIEVTFSDRRKHELTVTTYQMCVLMLFNSADLLTYEDIEMTTRIPSPDLKRCLQALALVKGQNVLQKNPLSREVSKDDIFIFNDSFKSRLLKVKMKNVAMQESEQAIMETRRRLDADRKPLMDATIIRIMKSRRVLEHNTLVSEVTRQLQPRFLPSPVVIKKCIEGLIEREFLDRDESDRKVYRYLS